MNILLTGATGFVGRELTKQLLIHGHSVRILTRNPDKAKKTLPYPIEIHQWDGKSPPSKESVLGVEAVIHLAGESLIGRWTDEKKKKIISSRVDGTKALLESLKQNGESLKVVVGASAVGYYGNTGDANIDETDGRGSDFLAEVCQKWEEALHSVDLPGVRKVSTRFGVVLGRDGGMVKQMLLPFQLGLGGRVGSGRQWISWIHRNDLIRAILFILEEEKIEGAVNLTAPHPVRHKTFIKALGKAVQKPAMFFIPGVLVRWIMGEVANMILTGQRVYPLVLKQHGFTWQYSHVLQALQKVCGTQFGTYVEHYSTSQFLQASPQEVFKFHCTEENLNAITPAWLNFHIAEKSTEKMQEGSTVEYALKIRGVPVKWLTLIKTWNAPYEFVDTQVYGPFSLWHHTHRFHTVKDGTLKEEIVYYRLPFGMLGFLIGRWWIRKDVKDIFQIRQAKTKELIEK